MMYQKENDEHIRQGDILEFSNLSTFFSYINLPKGINHIIILTPECDIQHDKFSYHRFTPLFPAEILFLSIYKKHFEKLKVNDANIRSYKNRVINIMGNKPKRYHFLRKDDKYITQNKLLDFELIGIIDKSEISGSDRIVRLSSPFRENLVHRYGYHCMQMGLPDIEKKQIKQWAEDITTKCSAASVSR